MGSSLHWKHLEGRTFVHHTHMPHSMGSLTNKWVAGEMQVVSFQKTSFRGSLVGTVQIPLSFFSFFCFLEIKNVKQTWVPIQVLSLVSHVSLGKRFHFFYPHWDVNSTLLQGSLRIRQ